MAVTGLAVSLPAGTQALAQLNPVVLKRLDLDAATLSKVKAYDRYRTREAGQKEKAEKALAFARKQIGKPYRWGAAGPGGYDCSGLAMASWRKAGVKLPRVTYSQYSGVKRKVRLKDLRPGDLIFFHGRSHVGIYLGDGKFLHAPNRGSTIRIDKFGAARKRQFAGAVRPGAPAYKKWSPSIRELVDKIDRMSAQDNATQHDEANLKPPDTASNPPTTEMPDDFRMDGRKSGVVPSASPSDAPPPDPDPDPVVGATDTATDTAANDVEAPGTKPRPAIPATGQAGSAAPAKPAAKPPAKPAAHQPRPAKPRASHPRPQVHASHGKPVKGARPEAPAPRPRSGARPQTAVTTAVTSETAADAR
ncbi:C40 family peptidase [Actinomadura macra]|uniref:C40 family peptidase n=1 Tax=Actinomadura macra TaxID=46164 RepID=UPI000830A57F|nr:C40 family peptidase [Actinomadura macra]